MIAAHYLARGDSLSAYAQAEGLREQLRQTAKHQVCCVWGGEGKWGMCWRSTAGGALWDWHETVYDGQLTGLWDKQLSGL